MLSIGGIPIEAPLALGPMAGVTDMAFRTICREQGAALTCTEMVSAKALCYQDKKSIPLLQLGDGEHPAAAQIFGSDPVCMEEAAAIARQVSGADFIDINMGCPAPKITGGGAGSALMRDPALCGRIVEAVVKAVDLPVTVKMRKGWDEGAVTCVEVARRCEAAGAAAIAVHGRTREQMYTPPIDPDCIAAVKAAVSVPVIGNGDVTSAAEALALLRQTDCDAVMIGRGALGSPWLFAEVKAALAGEPLPPRPGLRQRMAVMCAQLYSMCEEKGEEAAMRQARTQAPYYMKGLRGAAQLRRAACGLTVYRDAEELARLALQLNGG